MLGWSDSSSGSCMVCFMCLKPPGPSTTSEQSELSWVESENTLTKPAELAQKVDQGIKQKVSVATDAAMKVMEEETQKRIRAEAELQALRDKTRKEKKVGTRKKRGMTNAVKLLFTFALILIVNF